MPSAVPASAAGDMQRHCPIALPVLSLLDHHDGGAQMRCECLSAPPPLVRRAGGSLVDQDGCRGCFFFPLGDVGDGCDRCFPVGLRSGLELLDEGE